VRIVAGNRYTQVGSDVLAPGGDIDIVARTVSILAAQQSSRTVTEDKFRQQGVTVAVTSPVLSAVQTVQQMAEAASKTKSGRVQALAAATAGMSVYSAVGDMQKGAAEGSANIGISATIGSSQNSSRTEQNSVMQRGSTVASGGNMSISATGDGANSNLTVAGSDINAKRNLALKADNDINLIAAQNTDEQHGDRSSSSWGVGVTAQFGSKTQFGVTANAAGSRGNSDGKDVSNVMTQVRAGGPVKLESGRDTDLIGAAVSGKRVSEWLFSLRFWSDFNAKHGTMFDQFEEDEADLVIVKAVIESLDEKARALQSLDIDNVEFIYRWTSEYEPIKARVSRDLLLSEITKFREFLLVAVSENRDVIFSL
jgi:filamentous hemagglutinin